MSTLNEIEEKTFQELDTWINELMQTAFKSVELGTPPDRIADYIKAEIKTLLQMINTGRMRDFDEIYAEFMDEVVENGRYDDWLGFLRFREGLSDVHML